MEIEVKENKLHYGHMIKHPITKEEITFKDLPESIGTWCILKDINNL